MDTDNKLKKNPFVVPEGYFEQMEVSVHDKIFKMNAGNSWNRYFKPAMAMVCSFALIFGFAFLSSVITPSTSSAEDLFELSEYSMMTFIYEEMKDTSATPDISDEEIIDYLMAEDISTIYFAYNSDTNN